MRSFLWDSESGVKQKKAWASKRNSPDRSNSEAGGNQKKIGVKSEMCESDKDYAAETGVLYESINCRR